MLEGYCTYYSQRQQILFREALRHRTVQSTRYLAALATKAHYLVLESELSILLLMWLGNGLVNLEEFCWITHVVDLWNPSMRLDIYLY